MRQQIEFTKQLCGKALDARMEVQGEHPCPRCKQGVLVKRHGRNGDFWGCSNYPRCRMSCDDRDGSPDLAAAGHPAPSGVWTPKKGSAPAPAVSYAAHGYREAPPDELFEVLGSTYPTEEEIAEYEASRRPMWGAPDGGSGDWKHHSGQPKYSARPMEVWKDTGGTMEKKYLCPKCREGNLRKVRGKNGAFWGCTNYPRCTATFDDSKDGPVLG